MTTPFRDPLGPRIPGTPEDFRAGGTRRSHLTLRDRQSLWITPLIKATGLRTVKLMLGDGGAQASSEGGWSFVSRPRTTGFTTWDGRQPYVMTIPVMLDGFDREESIEAEWEALRSIFRNGVGPERQPSPVSLTGAVPLSHLIWVIQNIEPSLELRRASDAHRVRIVATLTVMQFIEADVIVSQKRSPAKAAAARKTTGPAPKDMTKMKASEIHRLKHLGWVDFKSDNKELLYPPGSSLRSDGTVVTNKAAYEGRGTRIYVVKRGDTLVKIAQSQLGTYRRWQEIAKLNGIRDPRTLKIGQRLKIPS